MTKEIITKHDERLIDLAESTTYPDTIAGYIEEAETETAREILRDILYQMQEDGLCEDDEPRRRW